MVYRERAAWSALIGTALAVAAYVVLLLGSEDPASSWLPLMVATVGGGILLSITLTIVGGLVAARRDPQAASASDVRDTAIARLGTRVEQAFLVIAGLGVVALCAVGAQVFWIAQTMLAGFAVSSFVGGVARVVAYRRGLV